MTVKRLLRMEIPLVLVFSEMLAVTEWFHCGTDWPLKDAIQPPTESHTREHTYTVCVCVCVILWMQEQHNSNTPQAERGWFMTHWRHMCNSSHKYIIQCHSNTKYSIQFTYSFFQSPLTAINFIFTWIQQKIHKLPTFELSSSNECNK